MKAALLFIILNVFGIAAVAAPFKAHHLHLPDLESPSANYPEKLKSPFIIFNEKAEAWQTVLQVGPRNLQWLALLNAHRAPADKIELTTPGTSKGIPIETPMRYNDPILNERWNLIEKDLPAELKSVLLSSDPLPTTLNVPVDTYKQWAKKIDALYSTALRWRGMKNYISYYRELKVYDFRGLHFLAKMGDADAKKELEQIATLPAARQEELKQWVFGVCSNALEAMEPCLEQLKESLAKNALFDLYQTHKTRAAALYDSFFVVQVPRSDITTTGTSLTMNFRSDADDKINQFVKINVEDEFKWLQGFLKIVTAPFAAANIAFKPGVVAHVDSVGGNNIVMNSEISLDSWDSQWTLRHEFGHVLGFPDCYIEFWDDSEAAYISYQFDVDNLMCSRAGRFNSRNEQEMKKAYGIH
ncbi:hypothetical protein [Bdellovibrio bacteriovorus]|uniref:hypothetical protein n=1 Tax=Bdellovibrio TaxID=958 RepID=UPI0035A8F4AA